MSKFVKGQMIVCVDNANFPDFRYKEVLSIGKTYLIKQVRDGHVILDKSGFGFSTHRFISIAEYRRMKIKSLYE